MRKASNTLAVGLVALSCLTVQQEAKAELFSAMLFAFGLKAAMPVIYSVGIAAGMRSFWKLWNLSGDVEMLKTDVGGLKTNMREGFAEAKADRDAIAQAAAQDREKFAKEACEGRGKLSGQVDDLSVGQQELKEQGDDLMSRFETLSVGSKEHFGKADQSFGFIMRDVRNLGGIEGEVKGLRLVVEEQGKKQSEENKKLYKRMSKLVTENAALKIVIRGQRKRIESIGAKIDTLQRGATDINGKLDRFFELTCPSQQLSEGGIVCSVSGRLSSRVMSSEALSGQDVVLHRGHPVLAITAGPECLS